MPTYVYECRTCENRFEIEQRMSDAALTVCGECGGTIRRIIQPVGIAFKGAGFYVNDSTAKPAAKEEAKPAETKVETPAPETAAAPAPTPGPTSTPSSE